MLVLSRKKGEEIVIGDAITMTIVDIRGDKVRVGIEAPREIPVHRREVKEAIDRAAASGPPAERQILDEPVRLGEILPLAQQFALRPPVAPLGSKEEAEGRR